MRNLYNKRKPAKSGKKTLNQRFGANLKNNFFVKFGTKFATFLHFFSFLAPKMLKVKISKSVFGAQHPKTGQNIQHLCRASIMLAVGLDKVGYHS